MKSALLLTLALAVSLGASSCANATKKKTDADSSILGKLSEGNELSDETIAELKDIADDPNSNLPVDDSDSPDLEFTSLEGFIDGASETKPEPVTFDPVKKWATNGMNPASVNPGDIFSESMGPVLNKALSLSDEIPSTERSSILSQIATHKSRRFPITFSQQEIDTLRSQAPPEVELPTRSVALDVKTHIREVESDRYELFLEKLATGDTGGAISSTEQRKKLQDQLADVKKRLKKGEELFIVTAVTESEKIDAHYPGAPVGSRDAAPIRNAIQSLYPHLTELNAEREKDRVVITSSPRLLWEFESKALQLENENVVIKEETENEVAQR
ncbi:hypothetical protein VSU19_10350 [Verrucomicrobiales bacterium BCK34]|nr:hypothetical protein [Verrucomicrobiales bacterium BCK34]